MEFKLEKMVDIPSGVFVNSQAMTETFLDSDKAVPKALV